MLLPYIECIFIYMCMCLCMCVLVRSLFMVFRSQQWMLGCCPPWYRARPLSPGSWRHPMGAAQQELVWFCHTPALVRELTLYNTNALINRLLLTGIENIQCVCAMSCCVQIPFQERVIWNLHWILIQTSTCNTTCLRPRLPLHLLTSDMKGERNWIKSYTYIRAL